MLDQKQLVQITVQKLEPFHPKFQNFVNWCMTEISVCTQYTLTPCWVSPTL